MEAAIYSKGIHNKNMSVTLIYVISRPLGWNLLSSCKYHEPPTSAFLATSVQHRTDKEAAIRPQIQPVLEGLAFPHGLRAARRCRSRSTAPVPGAVGL